MFLAALLLFAATAVGDDTMESLLRELHSDDPDARSKASAGILSGWTRWKEADLLELEKAALDPDLEVWGRAAEARARIRIRRTFGQNLFNQIDKIDDAFFNGDDPAKLRVLRKAKMLWKMGNLTKEDLAGLERLAMRAEWSDATALQQFLSEPDVNQAFAIPADAEARAQVRIKDVERLGTEGRKRFDEVAEYLGDGAPEVRATALRVMDRLQAHDLAPKVAVLLKDRHAAVRGDALALLRSWGATEYAADFTMMLEDPNGAVRCRAMGALGAFGQKDAGPRIAKFLKDPFPSSRAEAALALGSLGAREFADDLVALLGDPQPLVRRSATFALGRVGAVEAAPRLRTLLKDPSAEVRLAAAQSLGQLASGFRPEEIAGLLRDDEAEVGVEVAWVLGFTASKASAEGLARLLDASDVDVRQRAVWALGLLKARGFRPSVAALLGDPVAWVRAEAVQTLGRIGNPEDLPSLAARLRDPDRRVRVHAALALGELGAGDPQGILAGLERDPDRLLGLSSTLSLARLGLGNAAGLRSAFKEIAADDVAFACLGTAASDVASYVHSREAWTLLDRPLKLQRSVETWKDLSSALSDAGLMLEIQTDCMIGRLDRSQELTGRDALAWLFGRYWAPVLVLDGKKIRVMDRRDSLLYWQNRLEAK
jgi:HEAT repeat protein